MASAEAISNDGFGPVAEWRRRESGATLYILVQFQAGSPAFARFASYGWASRDPLYRSEVNKGCPATARNAAPGSIRQPQNPANSRLMAPLKPFRGWKIWSKDASRA